MPIIISAVLSLFGGTTTLTASQPIDEPSKPTISQEYDFTSTSSVREFIRNEAVKKEIDPDVVEKIVLCESGFVPQQSNYYHEGERENSWGIWQFNLPSWKEMTREQAMDIPYSTEKALELIKEGKINLWSCAKNLSTPIKL